MEPAEALQTAARRYCDDRVEQLWQAARRGQPIGIRHLVLWGIRDAVELFTSFEFSSLSEARRRLVEAGEGARITGGVNIPASPTREQRREIEEETQLFSRYVRYVNEADLARVKPLPFGRTLTEAESAAIWEELRTRWGVTAHYWYPLESGAEALVPPHTVAFDWFDADVEERLRKVLFGLGVSRVFELPEIDAAKEIELASVKSWRMTECFWTDASMDWVIYSSHESSITVAGQRLLPAFQEAWPDWRDHLLELASGRQSAS